MESGTAVYLLSAQNSLLNYDSFTRYDLQVKFKITFLLVSSQWQHLEVKSLGHFQLFINTTFQTLSKNDCLDTNCLSLLAANESEDYKTMNIHELVISIASGIFISSWLRM